MIVARYTIYHSPNAYLGVVLAERALAGLPITIEPRPIFVPKDRGVKIAELVGGAESPAKTSYHREDVIRWADRFSIPIKLLAPGVFEARAAVWARSPLGREELPARAYYAARDLDPARALALDRALFRAAWIESQDVNDPSVISRAAIAAGLDPSSLLAAAHAPAAGLAAAAALASFDDDACPGVPCWVTPDGARFWGKDRLDFLADYVRSLPA
ncbi:MAG TPA: DsbA family protein [Kofleriaceae bacterium]|nr:DsbA family protein [Kofleriaceae bacterium]